MTEHPAWRTCFVDPDTNRRIEKISLDQVDRKTFILESSLQFVGKSGLKPGSPPPEEDPRLLRAGGTTDLTSVPAAMRWFVGRYGIHTPAALLHDRLIGETRIDGVSDVEADLFFRNMLKALGVRFLRRWLMWSVVAFGTRWRTDGRTRALLAIWVAISVAGQVGFILGVLSQNWWLIGAAFFGPVPAAPLWGRQRLAAVWAAYCAPWLIPPTLLGAVGFGVYWVLEVAICSISGGERTGSEPANYESF